MTHGKIDPKSPGASTTSHADPHGRVRGPGSGGARDGGGAFKTMAKGGESPHGDAIVQKYKSRGSSPAQVNVGSELNDDGDGWK